VNVNQQEAGQPSKVSEHQVAPAPTLNTRSSSSPERAGRGGFEAVDERAPDGHRVLRDPSHPIHPGGHIQAVPVHRGSGGDVLVGDVNLHQVAQAHANEGSHGRAVVGERLDLGWWGSAWASQLAGSNAGGSGRAGGAIQPRRRQAQRRLTLLLKVAALSLKCLVPAGAVEGRSGQVLLLPAAAAAPPAANNMQSNPVPTQNGGVRFMVNGPTDATRV